MANSVGLRILLEPLTELRGTGTINLLASTRRSKRQHERANKDSNRNPLRHHRLDNHWLFLL